MACGWTRLGGGWQRKPSVEYHTPTTQWTASRGRLHCSHRAELKQADRHLCEEMCGKLSSREDYGRSNFASAAAVVAQYCPTCIHYADYDC